MPPATSAAPRWRQSRASPEPCRRRRRRTRSRRSPTASSVRPGTWTAAGCWRARIAAEAGASLPVQSTAIGVSGQANGEWIVAFNGPAGQSGNWQSLVHAGEVVVIGTSGGGGHITTCVSGSGSTAMLVDNITYVNSQGKIANPANDGSSSDIIVAAPHAASQEWSGVQGSSVVIYELDTPVVSATVDVGQPGLPGLAIAGVAVHARAIRSTVRSPSWQVYDTATSDSLLLNGTTYSAHSAASAVTAHRSRRFRCMRARRRPPTRWRCAHSMVLIGETGSRWPSPSRRAKPAAPVLAAPTSSQTWTGGKAFSLTLPSGTFTDPQHQALKYAATLSNGQALAKLAQLQRGNRDVLRHRAADGAEPEHQGHGDRYQRVVGVRDLHRDSARRADGDRTDAQPRAGKRARRSRSPCRRIPSPIRRARR